MNPDNNKVQVVIRAVNLVICGAFLLNSIKRVNVNQWNPIWIWIWGALSLLSIVLLVIKAKDLKTKNNKNRL